MHLEKILKPFSLRSLKLSNRFVMAPMTRNKSKSHIPGNDVADYYRRRALGGIGLIITEGTVINHKAGHGYPDVPSFYGKEALDGWRQVVNSVHQEGGKIFPQLWHVGSVRQTHTCHNRGTDNPKATCCFEGKIPGFGPSAIAHPYVEDAEIPHEMSSQDILEVINAFAQGALDAKELGFDGVELHGAHGYLIDQFFWQHTNKRSDRYGGKSIAERTQFAQEIIKGVRKAVGPDFPIDFRFSQWKLGDYKARLAQTPQELESFLTPLVDAGVDIFHCSTRRFWEPEFSDSTLNLAGWTKRITGKPTITVGSVGLDIDFVTTMEKHKTTHQTQNNLEELLTRLANDEFDLVAIGRALLADPYWMHKIKEERFAEIIPFSSKSLDTLY